MINSKLIELCRSLNKQELNRLGLFLESKFLNQETQPKKTIRLFQFIKKVLTEEDEVNWSTRLTKAQAFAIIFEEATFQPKKLERIVSKLFNAIKSFIALECSGIQKDEGFKLLQLSRFYRERGLDQQFRLNINKLKKLQRDVTTHNDAYFEYQYQIEKEIGEEQALYNNRVSDVNLIQMFNKLELWQLVQKLKLLIKIYLQKVHANISLEAINIRPADIDHLLDEKPEWNQPIVKVYQQAFKLLYTYPDDNIEALENLRTLLQKNEQSLPAIDVYEFQSIIRTFTIKKYNEGNKSYLPIAFNIYKEHLQLGYLYQNNQIHRASFINIVIAGLKLKEVEWVEIFIHSHGERIIGSKTPHETVAFSLALLFFTRKEYEKALDLMNFDHQDKSLKIAAKRLEIKIYSELRSPLLESRLDAFKIYIFRLGKKHLTKREKLSNNNFIDVIRQIIHNKTFLNPTRVEKIHQKTEAIEHIADREWLLATLKTLFEQIQH